MILTLIEMGPAGPTDGSRHALAFARGLGGEDGLDAVLVDDAVLASDAELTGIAPDEPGVDHYYRIEHPALTPYSPDSWGAAVAQIIGNLQPRAVVASVSGRGPEIMAVAAAHAGLPLAARCRTLEATGDGTWDLLRVRQGGLVLEEATLAATTALVTVDLAAEIPAPHAQTPLAPESPADRPDAPAVLTFTPELDPERPRATLVSQTATTDAVTLATARIVVSGGRGLGSAEAFQPLEELAALTGGAVGCSRVATNNGWRLHRDQVGQTGTTVNPDLYIACGISGATQHWVGCMGSKHILAVNTDPDAALVNRASHAVIGDASEVISAVVGEIRRRGSSP